MTNPNPYLGAGGPSHNDSFVYAIGPKKGGPYKVGYAKHVPSRLSSLQVGSPVLLRTWGAWRCPENTARKVEQEIHRRAEWARVYGEWFDMDYKALHQIIEQTRARVLLDHGVLEVNGILMESKLSFAPDVEGVE